MLADHKARTAIVLGSGLAAAREGFEAGEAVDYADLPGLPRSTVSGHAGRLWRAKAGSEAVWIAQGRVHLYEGRTPWEVGAFVRLFGALGVERLILTNAAGGLNPGFRRGDWMLLEDHLNLTGRSPLEGGPHFVDMQGAYDGRLREGLLESGRRSGERIHAGVYAGLCGPQYETPAEVRMLGRLGADAVGMSTVLECIQARALGMRVAGISLVTNVAAGLDGNGVDHEEVLSAGAEAGGRLGRWLAAWIEADAA